MATTLNLTKDQAYEITAQVEAGTSWVKIGKLFHTSDKTIKRAYGRYNAEITAGQCAEHGGRDMAACDHDETPAETKIDRAEPEATSEQTLGWKAGKGRASAAATATAGNEPAERVTHCTDCGFDFKRPQVRKTCKAPNACAKRQAAAQAA